MASQSRIPSNSSVNGRGFNNWYQSYFDPVRGACEESRSILHGSWEETSSELSPPPPRPFDFDLGASGDLCSTGHGLRPPDPPPHQPISTEEHRRSAEDERLFSLEGNVLNLLNKFGTLLEEFGKRSKGGVEFPHYAPAMAPPPTPPPPSPDYYGYLAMMSSPFFGQYQQPSPGQYPQYEAQQMVFSASCLQPYLGLTPPSHSLFLQQQPHQFQQYQQYPTPPQPCTNSTSSAWNQQPSPNSPLLPPQHLHGTYSCYPLLYVDPSPPMTTNHEQQQQYQPATYAFDELAERKEACRGLNNEVLISDKMQQPAGHGNLLNIQGNHQPKPGPLIKGSDKEVQQVESNGKQYQVCPFPQEASQANALVHAIVVSTLDEYKKANKISSRLDEDQISGVGKSGKLSNASPLLAVDTGEPDNFVTEALIQKQVVQSIGDLTVSGSLDDDLFGSDLIVDMNTNGSRSEDTVIKEKDNGTVTEEEDDGEPRIDMHTVHEELDKLTIEAEDETESGVVQANVVSPLQPDILNSGHVVLKIEIPRAIAFNIIQSEYCKEDPDMHSRNSSTLVEARNSSTLVEDQSRNCESAFREIIVLNEFGESRESSLQDLAILTGGDLITEELDMNLEKAELEMLGTCKLVTIIEDDNIVILDGAVVTKSLVERCYQLRSTIDASTHDYDKVKTRAEAVWENAPDASLHVISNLVNYMVLKDAEVLKLECSQVTNLRSETELCYYVASEGLQDCVHFVNKILPLAPYLAAIEVLVQNSLGVSI